MLPSFKKADGAETKVLSKREQKKGINIRWNSRLSFQLSLIGCLLLTFLVMESGISLGSGYESASGEVAYLEEPAMTVYQLYEEPKVEIKKPKVIERRVVQKKITTVFEVKNDDTKEVETKTESTEVKQDATIPKKKSTGTAPVMPEPAGNIFDVDEIPAFPGCEGFTNKEERLACFSSKIRSFIGKKFDTGVVPERLSGTRQRISVQFTVDSNGNVVDILSRAPGKELEREATRVISKLPKMTPAKKKNQNVDMIYQIPIVVQAEH